MLWCLADGSDKLVRFWGSDSEKGLQISGTAWTNVGTKWLEYVRLVWQKTNGDPMVELLERGSMKR